MSRVASCSARTKLRLRMPFDMQPGGTKVRPGQHDLVNIKTGVIFTATLYDAGELPLNHRGDGAPVTAASAAETATPASLSGGDSRPRPRRARGLLPLLLAHSGSETTDSWTFVLENLKAYLATTALFVKGLGAASVGMNKVIFMSDMGGAVQAAVAHVFPSSPHLLCVEHRKVRGHALRVVMHRCAGHSFVCRRRRHGVHACVSLCSETSRSLYRITALLTIIVCPKRRRMTSSGSTRERQ